MGWIEQRTRTGSQEKAKVSNTARQCLWSRRIRRETDAVL